MFNVFNLITLIGFTAQGLFFSRFFFQLIASEKQQKVVTPSLFWKLSLLASTLLFFYGYLRDDFSIMLGQTLTYYIYIRNLQLQGEWKKLPLSLRWCFYLFPVIGLSWLFLRDPLLIETLFNNNEIPLSWILLGTIAQLVFILRFVYQWFQSERKKVSYLPLGFWLISISGALLILSYAILRQDLVLFVSHCLGIAIYSRNIYLHFKKG